MALLKRRKKGLNEKTGGLKRRAKLFPKEKEEFNRGGHVKNPPVYCPRRKKFEMGGAYWAETTFCGFYCNLNQCEYWQKFHFGRKRR